MSEALTVLDRAIGYLAPAWGLRRARARMAAELLARHYEGAASGRRTQGWRRSLGDVNVSMYGALALLRENARDLVRNNGHAESAVDTIADHVVGWGIEAKPNPVNKRAADLWAEWAGTAACDSDGRLDFAGIQHLVMRTVVEAGECLVRKRVRRPEDGLPIPLQLQVLEPDYIDTMKNETLRSAGGNIYGRIVNGIEFDQLGRRTFYWMFREHPGSEAFSGVGASQRVPAESILHVYKHVRPGQVRGASWFAPVLLMFKDFAEYFDAEIMKQKIAACLAVIVSGGDGAAIGTLDTSTTPAIDSLEPGAIVQQPPGSTVEVVRPPNVQGFDMFSEVSLRAIATGLGVTYEDLTGDYTDLPFSAARMSRLRHWGRVEAWRWKMLIPQLCTPVWQAAMTMGQIAGRVGEPAPLPKWTAPPLPIIEQDKEALGHQRMVRSGLKTLSECIRELGYDPEDVLAEMAEDNKLLDKLGLVLDSDPRRMTQGGQAQAPEKEEVAAPPKAEAAPEPAPEADDADERKAVREHRERMRLIELAATKPPVAPPAPAPEVNVNVAPAKVEVDARTTIAEGAIRAEVPVTIAETAALPPGRQVIERDPETGRITAIRNEDTPPASVRVSGVPRKRKGNDDAE